MAGDASSQRPVRLLTIAVVALMPLQAALGLLLPGEYRDPEWIRATWFGNDCVSLLIALPLLVASFVSSRRASARGVLVWLGMLAYATYNYAFYLFGAA